MEGLQEVEDVAILDTPFGPPSESYMVGTLHGQKIAFLARHGRGHRGGDSRAGDKPGARSGTARRKIPDASRILSRQVTRFVQELRNVELYKVPGVAETLDWVRALVAMDKQALDPQVVDETLGALLKYREDIEVVRRDHAEPILERSQATS